MTVDKNIFFSENELFIHSFFLEYAEKKRFGRRKLQSLFLFSVKTEKERRNGG